MVEPLLSDIVHEQLASVCRWARLSAPARDRVTEALSLLASEAMHRSVGTSFDGLSRVNADGLPFQWCFTFDGGPPAVRFLCECGTPHNSPERRYFQSLEVLKQVQIALGVTHPAWFEDEVLPRIMPEPGRWPSHWRSGLWLGIGVGEHRSVIKPYMNLNRDAPIERWKRVGRVLRALGRLRSLDVLCACSRHVSAGSWPVGLAIDVRQDGTPGRVKVYFRSGEIGPDWLERWYAAFAADSELPLIKCALDAFPTADRRKYAEGMFIVSVEFHTEDGIATLKTDIAATRCMDNDAQIMRSAQRIAAEVGVCGDALLASLGAVGAWPPVPDQADVLRFIGVGYEPDGSRHLNIYVEPPLVTASRPPHAARAGRDASTVVRDALEFLVTSRRDAHWSDYNLTVGDSDQWVTAYVLCQLSTVSPDLFSTRVHDAVEESLDWLIDARTAEGGWGYNGSTGADTDSTALAILALDAHDRPVPSAAYDTMLRCQTPEGGFGTYPPETAYGTWTEASADVTARAARALDIHSMDATHAALTFLIQHQRSDGTWPAFWWPTPLVATQAALQAFARSLGVPNAARLRRTLRGYVAINVFETALLLSCCRHMSLHELVRTLAHQLISEQLPCGAWRPSAYLRLTYRTVREPWKTVDAGPLFLDGKGIFTTATVVHSLAQIASRL